MIPLAELHTAHLVTESRLEPSWKIGRIRRDTLLRFLASLRAIAQFHIECVNGASLMRQVEGFGAQTPLQPRTAGEKGGVDPSVVVSGSLSYF
jgi:hypothetical protein